MKTLILGAIAATLLAGATPSLAQDARDQMRHDQTVQDQRMHDEHRQDVRHDGRHDEGMRRDDRRDHDMRWRRHHRDYGHHYGQMRHRTCWVRHHTRVCRWNR